MNEKPDSLRVAAIGDLHVHQNSSQTLEALFEKVSRSADVLALCGDLTHLGLPQEADRLANDLRSCRIPVVAVLGNHDYQSGQADEVKKLYARAKLFCWTRRKRSKSTESGSRARRGSAVVSTITC